MTYPWIEPLPRNVEVLNAHFWAGRLQLEVEGAPTHQAKAKVGRRFAALGDVYVESMVRQPRACLGHFEREERQLELLFEMRADEQIDRLVVAEGGEQVVVFATIRVPDLGDADAFERDQQVLVRLREPLGEREVVDGWTGWASPPRDIRTEIGPSGAVRALHAPPPIIWDPPSRHPMTPTLREEGSPANERRVTQPEVVKVDARGR